MHEHHGKLLLSMSQVSFGHLDGQGHSVWWGFCTKVRLEPLKARLLTNSIAIWSPRIACVGVCPTCHRTPNGTKSVVTNNVSSVLWGQNHAQGRACGLKHEFGVYVTLRWWLSLTDLPDPEKAHPSGHVNQRGPRGSRCPGPAIPEIRKLRPKAEGQSN